MKNLKHFMVVLSVLLLGCGNLEKEEKFSLHRAYIEQQAQGEAKSYIHYLTLSGIKDDHDNFNFVFENVKNYFDTCSIKKPIRAICLIRKSNKHHFEIGEPNYQEVYKDAVLELYFNYRDTSSFPIEKIAFLKMEKRKK